MIKFERIINGTTCAIAPPIMATMKKLLSVLAAVSLVACGSGSVCQFKSKCSADGEVTQQQRDSCEADLKANTKPCLAEGTALNECMIANQMCGTDNKTDLLKTLEKCPNQVASYNKCVTPKAVPAGNAD